ncbi:MAG: hypothetical protein ABFS34_07915 [Gemmatimonadota bacterium]
MTELLLWPVPAIGALLVAALAFWAGRMVGRAQPGESTTGEPDGGGVAGGADKAAAGLPQDHPLRDEMLGIMRSLEKAGGQSVILEVAARVLGSSRVRVEEAAEALSALGLVSVNSPLRRPNYVQITERGRRWLESFGSVGGD